METYKPFGCPEIAGEGADSSNTALSHQVGGEHYKSAYQPIVLMEKVHMFPSCANVLKYVFRHKQKNGKQDLQKALHFCGFIDELKSNWYYGTSMRIGDGDSTSFEFYKFIKENKQLDKNQIRAIIAILYRDLDMLKQAIYDEISEYYS